MTWGDWLTATASAIAILAALIGAASYCLSKWKARRQQEERERIVRFAEAAKFLLREHNKVM